MYLFAYLCLWAIYLAESPLSAGKFVGSVDIGPLSVQAGGDVALRLFHSNSRLWQKRLFGQPIIGYKGDAEVDLTVCVRL